MKTNVYCIFRSYNYEGSELIHVASSRTKALRWSEKYISEQSHRIDGMGLQVWRIDKDETKPTEFVRLKVNNDDKT